MRINQKISLREWQKKAFNNWETNNYKGIFSVVTGGGKTIFGIYCLSYLFEKDLIKNAIIIVPTKTLQDQWATNIVNLTTLNLENINFNYKKKSEISILVNISAQKISQTDDYQKTALICDECHRYGTEKNLSFLKKNFGSTIGLTATLERMYDDGVEEILKPNLGEVVYAYGVKQALDDGVVENYKMKYLKTRFNDDEELEYHEISKNISKLFAQLKSNKDQDFHPILKKRIDLLVFKRSRLVNESIERKYVATHLIIKNNDRKKIIFCETVKQAEEIKEECLKKKLDTLIYHSRMSRKDRLFALNSFYSNHYNTLIGCRALDEGFDVPDIDFAIIVSQTKTKRQRIQRLGRTIRKNKNKKPPIIYTLYTVSDELIELQRERYNYSYIDTEWMELT